MTQATRTTLNRTWLIKMAVFFAFLAGLGAWGYYDATVKWPARGVKHAEWAQWTYLGRAVGYGFTSKASVADPVTEYDRLRLPAKLAEIRAAETAEGFELEKVELARYTWLLSLDRVKRLDAQYTLIEDPRDMFETLDDKWKQSTSPKPLAGYDILMQWIIAGAGFGGALFMVALFGKVARNRYSFEQESLMLTLPNGTTLVPGDIDVFDKRKWHRFIVYMKIDGQHDKLGGKELRLDLLRYSPLEDWVKQMFKSAHPDEYRESFPDEFAEPAGVEGKDEDGKDEGSQEGAAKSEEPKADPAAESSGDSSSD